MRVAVAIAIIAAACGAPARMAEPIEPTPVTIDAPDATAREQRASHAARERDPRDRDLTPRGAFVNRDTRWLQPRKRSPDEDILRRRYGSPRWRDRSAATPIHVAESDMWSPCVKDYVRAQPERARRALPAALARYVTSCDGDRRVVFERPLAGGRLRRSGSDIFLVGTFGSTRHEVALRITYCGQVRPRADRAVLVSDGSAWTSLPLVFEPDAPGCSVAQIPYTDTLGRVVRDMVDGREASVRFEGRGQYDDIILGDELRSDLRVMLDVADALRD